MNETQGLLIEDDPVLGGALLQRLRLEGLSAQWVQSCAQAVEWFRRSRQRPAFVPVSYTHLGAAARVSPPAVPPASP